MEIVFSLTINALIAAAIYGLVASGLSFIYTTTRVFHLAHGGVIAFSAYVFWWAVQMQEIMPIAAGFLAIAVAGFVGFLMNEFVYEPLRRRATKSVGFLVATFALLFLMNVLILLLFGAQTHSLNFQSQTLALGGAQITTLQLTLIGVAGVSFLALWWLVKYTKFGKAMRATSDNETVAKILGINTRNIRRMVFLIGSLLGGVAGIILALEINLTPSIGVMLAIKGFTVMIVGGAGTFGGILFGCLALGAIEQMAVWFLGSTWKDAVSFLLLFVFLLVKPAGLFARSRTY